MKRKPQPTRTKRQQNAAQLIIEMTTEERDDFWQWCEAEHQAPLSTRSISRYKKQRQTGLDTTSTHENTRSS